MVSFCCIATRELPLMHFFPSFLKCWHLRVHLFGVKLIYFVGLPNVTIVENLQMGFLLMREPQPLPNLKLTICN